MRGEHPLGITPDTGTCALTGIQTGDLLVHGPVLNQLSHAGWAIPILTLKGILIFKQRTLIASNTVSRNDSQFRAVL